MFAHCKKNHKACWEESQPFMPTRLIDVGRPGEQTATISLREHLSEPQPYLTLSYRWANNQDTALTTRANREQRLRGFPAAELPQLMQDVVAMARKLGIRYVWIDAVCIIQDDREDWALEAPQMSKIYRESALTLSISTALDDSNSITTRHLVDIPFAHPAATAAPTPPAFFVRTAPTHNVPHSLTAIHGHLGPTDGTGKDLPAALASRHPVFARGWCLQERLLSRRVLHHTATELVWACRRATWCECGATSRRHPPPPSPRCPRRRKATVHQAPISAPDVMPLVFEDWRMLVHDYSWNELTYDGDVLPAISGLAHAYQEGLGGAFVTGAYSAGHWGRDLPHSLLWHTLDARDFVYVMAGTDVEMTNSRRPPDVAPSWSWASVRGPVRWPTEGVFAVVNEFECARDGVEVEWAEVKPECKLKTGDEMGQLAGEAEMWVKTRVVREVKSAFLEACCSAPPGFAKEPPDDDVLFVSELADGKEVCMSVFLDTVEDRDAWRENSVWFARVCRVTREEDAELSEEGMRWRRRVGTVALMLLRRDDGKFRRIGIATSPRKRIDGVDVGIFAQEVGDAKGMIDSPEDNAFDECFESVEEIEICIV
ncbi:hypothetical protein DIS24_g12062 [Lasiodiplodia hormozganensis]|uniref:Heterokaryon incompatibility domain-containing protein n=1 Tax=Lasiodiplodia hormozganensis TaxID=869390 RepID=A0AA39TK85_9PEZI|nr:hypothetical protein DIS24_g12062 [Lasiodiplodia hormozganensis]